MEDRLFYCNTCEKEFSSWKALKVHYRSEEHKKRAGIGNPEVLAERFAKRFNEMDNGSNKV